LRFEKKNENIGSRAPENRGFQPCVRLSLEQDISGNTFHRGRERPSLLKTKHKALQGLERGEDQKETFKERRASHFRLFSPFPTPSATWNCQTLISLLLSAHLPPRDVLLPLTYGPRDSPNSLVFLRITTVGWHSELSFKTKKKTDRNSLQNMKIGDQHSGFTKYRLLVLRNPVEARKGFASPQISLLGVDFWGLLSHPKWAALGLSGRWVPSCSPATCC
jgi:hypothetical protein